ncbi:MAG: hypothetical protein V3W44_09650 [Dehalococcoidales bacterium]
MITALDIVVLSEPQDLVEAIDDATPAAFENPSISGYGYGNGYDGYNRHDGGCDYGDGLGSGWAASRWDRRSPGNGGYLGGGFGDDDGAGDGNGSYAYG